MHHPNAVLPAAPRIAPIPPTRSRSQRLADWTRLLPYRLREPVQARFRRTRMAQMQARANLTEDSLVLDVGGGPANWRMLEVRPKVVMLNLYVPTHLDGGLVVVADGRQLPFRGDGFDLVFSNSMIEHVGTPASQLAVATEIRRTGRRYYVQTPNRRFFFDPHTLAPFWHWLPPSWQRPLLRWVTPAGVFGRYSKAQVADWVETTHMLDRGQLPLLFPDGELTEERALGAAKSFVVWGGFPQAA